MTFRRLDKLLLWILSRTMFLAVKWQLLTYLTVTKNRTLLGKNTTAKYFDLNTRSANNESADLELLFNVLDVLFNVILLSETRHKCDRDIFKRPYNNSHSVHRPISVAVVFLCS